MQIGTLLWSSFAIALVVLLSLLLVSLQQCDNAPQIRRKVFSHQKWKIVSSCQLGAVKAMGMHLAPQLC